MITLYHGSNCIIRQPEIREPNRTLDFGKGFYLTSSKEQATDWVRRKIELNTFSKGYVNEYSFQRNDAMQTLRVKTFDHPSDEWLDFVMANRRHPQYTHDFDIVIGPVANDRVYTAFALYEGGSIGKDTLIAELRTYRLVDQYLFHTEQALPYLTFLTSFQVDL